MDDVTARSAGSAAARNSRSDIRRRLVGTDVEQERLHDGRESDEVQTLEAKPSVQTHGCAD
jgi:hypothetical protein